MSWILAAPIIIPFATAVLAFLFRKGPEGRWLSVVGSTSLLIASGILMAEVLREGVVAAQMGQWAAPFGITLVADLLSAVMVVITGITGLAVAIYALADVDERKEALGYHALFQVLLAGRLRGVPDRRPLQPLRLVRGDADRVLRPPDPRRAEGAAGRRDQVRDAEPRLDDPVPVGGGPALRDDRHAQHGGPARRGAEVDNPGLLIVIAVMFMIAFGVKAAVFPLFFWLPASYHTPAFSVSAIFAGLLTKVGVYALIRVFTLIFTTDVAYTHTILLWVAGFTMVTGVLGAAAMNDFRRILSFHIVSQIGYMILGLALFTPLAIVGAVFYLVHHIIVKANLFLVAGVAKRIAGSTDLSAIGGLYKTAPLLGVLFLIPAFSLAGFPAAQRVLGEIRAGQGITRRRGLLDRRRCARRGTPDDLLHDEDLGQRVLETAPGGPWSRSSRARAEGPRGASRAHFGAGRADLHHRVLPRAIRGLRGALGRAAARPDRLCHGRAGRDAGRRIGPGGTGGKSNEHLRPQHRAGRRLGGADREHHAFGLVCRVRASGPPACYLTRPLFPGSDLYFKRVWRWAKLCVLFLYELIVSSVQVIWDVLTPQHKARPGIIAMPLDAEGRDGGAAGHQPDLADPGHTVARRDG
jgi:multicomponent Na+:H+ antiporter subunit D